MKNLCQPANGFGAQERLLSEGIFRCGYSSVLYLLHMYGVERAACAVPKNARIFSDTAYTIRVVQCHAKYCYSTTVAQHPYGQLQPLPIQYSCISLS